MRKNLTIRFDWCFVCIKAYLVLCFQRFQKCDMYHLLEALQIPECHICSQRTFVTGMEALMILLRRLTYPNRWCDLQAMFGRSESELCLIFVVTKTWNDLKPPKTT